MSSATSWEIDIDPDVSGQPLDFYPTPPALISHMLAVADVEHAVSILEPSAGNGALAERVKDRLRYGSRQSIHCIEIDPGLQATLAGKGFSVVHDDFLSFQSREKYDLIIANFPFSAGVEHALKALRVLRDGGGRLVCLVNAETIRNPYSLQRRMLAHRLADLGAEIEFIADAFKDADRKTGVEVALVNVVVPALVKPSIIMDGLKQAEHRSESSQDADKMTSTDTFSAMVERFNLESDAGLRLIQEWEALKPYMLDSIDSKYSQPILELQIRNARGTFQANEYLRALRRKYWQALVGNDQFRSMFTTSMLKELDARMEELSERDFSPFNIRWLERELRSSIVSGVEDSIMDIFHTLSDKWAHYDGCSNNVHYFNGWKTNKAHKVNNKVILPINGFNSWSGAERKLQEFGWASDTMRDLVQVFRYLSGEPIDATEIVTSGLRIANAVKGFANIDFHYFSASFYKKGTVHIRFKDQDLLDKLNIYGARGRGWLPPSYGKRQYQDMSPEEQSVVDEFQGESGYNAVMERPEFYLSLPVDNGLLALGGSI